MKRKKYIFPIQYLNPLSINAKRAVISLKFGVNEIRSLKLTKVLLLKQERKQIHKSRPKIEDVAKT